MFSDLPNVTQLVWGGIRTRLLEMNLSRTCKSPRSSHRDSVRPVLHPLALRSVVSPAREQTPERACRVNNRGGNKAVAVYPTVARAPFSYQP